MSDITSIFVSVLIGIPIGIFIHEIVSKYLKRHKLCVCITEGGHFIVASIKTRQGSYRDFAYSEAPIFNENIAFDFLKSRKCNTTIKTLIGYPEPTEPQKSEIDWKKKRFGVKHIIQGL